MGKSRLLASLDELFPQGAVLSICARPGDGVVPYAVANRLVRALLQRSNTG